MLLSKMIFQTLKYPPIPISLSHPSQHQHRQVIGGGHILHKVQQGFFNYIQQIRSGVAFAGGDGVNETFFAVELTVHVEGFGEAICV